MCQQRCLAVIVLAGLVVVPAQAQVQLQWRLNEGDRFYLQGMSTTTQTAASVDYVAIKGRQQATWSSGDYAVIGTTLQIIGETLCEAVDVAAGDRVLDVAAGNGNAALAAARRGADVVATDYVPALLERAQARAATDGVMLETREADAEPLVVEIHNVRERMGRAVMKIWRSAGEPAQDRPLHLADVRPLTSDQCPSRVGRLNRDTRRHILEGNHRQIAYAQGIRQVRNADIQRS